MPFNKDSVKRTIASNIKHARITANMTQAEAAAKLGITAQAISNFERGINGIENSLLLRMCEIYNTNLDSLLGGRTDRKEVTMPRDVLTDEQVELEIERLHESYYVKLANKERRVRNRRRMYLYSLRQLEKKGKALEEAGVTMETLDSMYNETIEEDA